VQSADAVLMSGRSDAGGDFQFTVSLETTEAGVYALSIFYHSGTYIEITPNEWHFFVFSTDGTNYTLSVDNGIPVSLSGYEWTGNVTFPYIIIGESNYNNTNDAIYVDEWGLYLKDFTSEDKAYLYGPDGAGRTLYP
jgi:hypothetical protein